MRQLAVAFARQTQQLQGLAALRVFGVFHQAGIEADGRFVVFRVEGHAGFAQLGLQYFWRGHGARRRVRGRCCHDAALGTLDRLGLLPAGNRTYRHRARRRQDDANTAEISFWLNFKLEQLGEAQRQNGVRPAAAVKLGTHEACRVDAIGGHGFVGELQAFRATRHGRQGYPDFVASPERKVAEIAHGASEADDDFTAPATAAHIHLANPLGFLGTDGLDGAHQPQQGRGGQPCQFHPCRLNARKQHSRTFPRRRRHQKLLLVTL